MRKIVEMSEGECVKDMKAKRKPCFIVESEAELTEKLEKGYADMLAGRVRPAEEVFAEIRKAIEDMRQEGPEMSLEEINAEIAACRAERKRKRLEENK